ncbi:MAG: glycine zipper 2TM domain-containing protein [Sphingopyxis sp.]|nr:glycine zipper 2TM domain-containing protein [Sphingopyxis sp.]
MNKLMILPLAAATALVAGCASGGLYGGVGAGAGSGRYDDGGYGYYDRDYYTQNGNYDYDRPDPRQGGYYADNYYRTDKRYRERRLSSNDRVYRGRDNKYYCRRNDGSTGLIVGGLAGGVVGNVVAPGGSETLGTILGAVGGAVAGRAIERSGNSKNDVRCR